MTHASMPWVKVYGEFLTDRKTTELSEGAQLTFIKLIILAGECDADGMLIDSKGAFDNRHICKRFESTVDVFEPRLKELIEAELVTYEDGALCVVNFAKRQGRKQSTRRAQWKEAQRNKRLRDSSKSQADVIDDSSMSHPPRVEKSREEKTGESDDSRVESIPPEATITEVQEFREEQHSHNGVISPKVLESPPKQEIPKRDAITEMFNRATKTKAPRDKVLAWFGVQSYLDILVQFVELTGIEPSDDNRTKWLKDARDWSEWRGTHDEMKAAYEHLRRGGATVKALGSLIGTAQSIRAERQKAQPVMASVPAGKKFIRWDDTPEGMVAVYG